MIRHRNILPLIIFILISLVLDLSLELTFYIGVYLVNLSIVPIKLKDNDLPLSKKIFLVMGIFSISVLGIIYFYGLEKTLFNYVIVFLAITIFSIGLNRFQRK